MPLNDGSGGGDTGVVVAVVAATVAAVVAAEAEASGGGGGGIALAAACQTPAAQPTSPWPGGKRRARRWRERKGVERWLETWRQGSLERLTLPVRR